MTMPMITFVNNNSTICKFTSPLCLLIDSIGIRQLPKFKIADDCLRSTVSTLKVKLHLFTFPKH